MYITVKKHLAETKKKTGDLFIPETIVLIEAPCKWAVAYHGQWTFRCQQAKSPHLKGNGSRRIK